MQENSDDSDSESEDCNKENDPDFIRISEIDTATLIDVMEKLTPNCPEFVDLLSDQIRNNQPSDPRWRRWQKSTIKNV